MIFTQKPDAANMAEDHEDARHIVEPDATTLEALCFFFTHRESHIVQSL